MQAVHFGGDNDEKKFVRSRIEGTFMSGSSSERVSFLRLHNPGSATFPDAASGCPVLIKSGDNFLLVGLQFSRAGDEAQALQWNAQGIHQYIHKGTLIITDIGGYISHFRIEKRTGTKCAKLI